MIYTTAKQMERLDEAAVANGLEIRQMMELAGFAMLQVFEELKISKDSKVVVIAGRGNKGGDGLSAARHLANHDWKNLEVILVSQDLKPGPRHHLELLKKMGVQITTPSPDQDRNPPLLYPVIRPGKKEGRAGIIIDALIGYHLDGAPREPFSSAIKSINDSGAEVIAYDLPSGMDATAGTCPGECVRADATLTLAAPKKCFQTESGKKNSGRVFLADIGIPEFLYKEVLGEYQSPFEGRGVVELR